MSRSQNPIGILSVLATAGLAAVGIAGFGMGLRERSRVVPASPPGGGPPPGTEPEPVRPELPQFAAVVADLTRQYPQARCERQGWAYYFSVTGAGDGAALEWRTYERPDQGWLLAYDYAHPFGASHGVFVASTRDNAYRVLDELKTTVVTNYEQAQQAVGSPYVAKRSSTGFRSC